jgi:hypothetical protein
MGLYLDGIGLRHLPLDPCLLTRESDDIVTALDKLLHHKLADVARGSDHEHPDVCRGLAGIAGGGCDSGDCSEHTSYCGFCGDA